MSERSHTAPTPEGEYFESSRFAGLSSLLGLIAIVALALCIVGAFLNPHQFSYSWLFAFAFFFTLCAGCFFWTIVHHATDAEWSVVVRRQLENIAALLTVLALLFVPILLLRHHLYAWMDIPPGVEPSLDTKRAYLNPVFFLVRAVVFLGFFLLAALALRRLSMEQDKNGNPGFTIGMRKVSFISLPMFALCLTFGAWDWLVSLNYRWFSTMFGVYIFAGAAGASMSLLVLVITALRKAGYLKDVVTVEHYHIMGKWMLAFTVFWAYIGFGQYMLIWYANIPEETQFFISSEHPIVVGAEHAVSDRSLLYSFCDLAHALYQEASSPALYHGRMDSLHANAGHVHHRPARVTRHGRARQHLGFAFPGRNRRDARFRLSTACAEEFVVSRARPATDRVSANSKLKWPTPNLFARLRTPARRCPHGWGLCFSSRCSA